MGEFTNLKKILFVSVLIVMCVFSLPAGAKYGGGSGTAEDPYLIYDANQMNDIGANSGDWDGHFKLMADIDLSDYNGTKFNLIGEYIDQFRNPFEGVFDGNGHTISNFTYTSTNISYVGLFRYVRGHSSTARIQNLRLTNPKVEISPGNCIGTLAGAADGNVFFNCTVEDINVVGNSQVGGIAGYCFAVFTDCNVSGSVSGSGHVGGLAGENNNESATNCSVDATVIGSNHVGGLFGYCRGTNTTDCTISGTVSGSGSIGGLIGTFIGSGAYMINCSSSCDVTGSWSSAHVGGLIGEDSGYHLRFCYATGDVSGGARTGGLLGSKGTYNEVRGDMSDCYATGNVSGRITVGGLVGTSYSDYILRCYATGHVTGEDYAGGLLGMNAIGTVDKCYATGDVAGNSDLGGLVGYNWDIIVDCYAAGSVTGGSEAGGLVGTMSNANILNCYATGAITASGRAGGLVGRTWDDVTVTASFWDINSTGLATSAAGIGKTTAEMQTEVTFTSAGWDFSTPTWRICDGVYYPSLFWQEKPFLVVFPSELEFIGIKGEANPPSKTISIGNFNIGGIGTTWEISESCEWIDVSPNSGHTIPCGSEDVSISVDVTKALYGLQSYQLTVSDPCSTNSPQVVTVYLDVLRPSLSVIPDNVAFVAAKDGADPNTQSLSIQNTGYGTLNWQIEIQPDCNWLSVYPMSGQSTVDVDEATLHVDITGMDHGFYDCELMVKDPSADNSPQTVYVTLELFLAGQVYVPSEFPTIQEAIDVTTDGAEVILEPGIYTGPGNTNIDFRGKAITVRSVAPSNPAIVAATIVEGHAFSFISGEGINSVLDGLTIAGGSSSVGGGILCRGSSPTIRNCIIRNCSAYSHGGGIGLEDSSAMIDHCTVTGNSTTEIGGGIACMWGGNPTITNCIIVNNSVGWTGGGIGASRCSLTVNNCTLSDNRADSDLSSFGGALSIVGTATISNSILWGNDANYGPEIATLGSDIPSTVTISYSNVKGGEAEIYIEPYCSLSWDDESNIDIDPCFAEPGYWMQVHYPPPPPLLLPSVAPTDFNDYIWINGDYHLKSEAGRWDPNRQSWVYDTNTSPCVDTGDPNSDWRGELWPHGMRINMGAYGGTREASMSLSDAGNIADLNFDGRLCYQDMKLLTDKWLYEELLLPEDLNRDGFVNFSDFSIFAYNWEPPPPPPGQAGNPVPTDGEIDVNVLTDLDWTTGFGTTSHDVYFGTSNPPPFVCNQTAATFDPGIMAQFTKYYWRVDEINTGGTTTGEIWSFTTMMNPPP